MVKRHEYFTPVTIRGIPAGVADVEVWGGCRQTDVDPGEEPTAEYVITDRKGYEARWLEEQMTEEDYQTLDEEVIEHERYWAWQGYYGL